MASKHHSHLFSHADQRPRHLRPVAKPADMPKLPVIVEARDPRRIKRQPALARRIVDNSTPDFAEDDQHQRGAAADRPWQAMVETVQQQSAAAQPASGQQPIRDRSRQ
jgi:hypothetical protein